MNKNNRIKLALSIIILTITMFMFINIQSSSINISPNKLYFHVIDIGQGDSLLFQVNGKNILIDSGPTSAKDEFLDYLHKLNITTIDYLIATHPHEDHIGNMDTIINNFNVKSFYAPKVTTTTKTFEDMINSLKDKSLKINVAKIGVSINLGPGTKMVMYAPIDSDYGSDLNNYSAVIKLTYYNTSFLCTGDAEKPVEDEMLANNSDLKADVLKVGHHGSSTSSSENFVRAVNPKFAAISVAKVNDYGHPNKVTMDLFKKLNIKTLLTYNGTILFISDGNNIMVSQYKK